MKDNESEFFKKYRVVNQITSSLPVMTQAVNDTVHVVSVTASSYNVYDTRRMNLVFCGPLFSRIHCAYQSRGVVYVGSYRTVYGTVRGEVVKSLTVCRGPVESNKRVRIAEETGDGRIVQITGFGEMVLILTGTEVVVTEDLEERYRIEHDGEIMQIFHPHTYVNKVVKVKRGGRMVLFNVSSRKEIYSYKGFSWEVVVIEQASVVDVVGIGLSNGDIHVFNLKTDKILFSFKVSGEVCGLSFGGDHLIVITSEGMSVFDLNEKKRIVMKSNVGSEDVDSGVDEGCGEGWRVLSGRFLDERSFVVCTGNSLEIYEINKYSVELVKRRRTYNGPVVGMEFVDQKNVVVFGPRDVFSVNLYRDEQSFLFKFKGHVEMMSVGGGGIVCFGRRSLYSLEYSEKNSKVMLHRDINCVAVYKDFCCFGKNKVVLMNVRSRLVHCKFVVGEEVVDLAMDFSRIVAATGSGIYMYNYQGRLMGKYEQTGIVSVRVMESFVVVCTENRVVLYDDTGVCREFGTSERITDYSVSKDMRWIGVLCEKKMFVYDMVTTGLLDILSMTEEGRFVRFSPRLDFVVVVTKNNDIVLFSNKSHFCTRARDSETGVDVSGFERSNEVRDVEWEKSRKSLYTELLLVRGLGRKETVGVGAGEGSSLHGMSPETLNMLLDEDWVCSLNKEQVLRIMDLVTPHASTSMEIVQRVLFNLLKHKSHMLEPEDVSSLHERFDREWMDFEENALKTIGYLKMEASGML